MSLSEESKKGYRIEKRLQLISEQSKKGYKLSKSKIGYILSESKIGYKLGEKTKKVINSVNRIGLQSQ